MVNRIFKKISFWVSKQQIADSKVKLVKLVKCTDLETGVILEATVKY